MSNLLIDKYYRITFLKFKMLKNIKVNLASLSLISN